MNYEANIGRRVRKGSISTGDFNRNPFKSGFLINTVKGVINHPILNVPAYTFEEDDSYVECRRCFFVDTHEVIDIIYHTDEGNVVFRGSYQECHDWISEEEQESNFFGYEVRPII